MEIEVHSDSLCHLSNITTLKVNKMEIKRSYLLPTITYLKLTSL